MKKTEAEGLNKRYYLLDSIRGICILGMIVYHTLFDIVAFFGVPVTEGLMVAIDVIRDFGASCFICLAGICMHFGKRPLKRFLLISAGAVVVSIATFITVPDMPVIFGILTFMAAASLIMMPLQKYLDKLPGGICALISFVLFFITFEVRHHYAGWYFIKLFEFPEAFYRNYFTAAIGFPFYGFATSDYYPLLPWIFMFFFGFFLWKVMKKSEKLMKILDFRIPFLEKIGKVSLYIYVLHQPVVLGILLLIFNIFFK